MSTPLPNDWERKDARCPKCGGEVAVDTHHGTLNPDIIAHVYCIAHIDVCDWMIFITKEDAS